MKILALEFSSPVRSVAVQASERRGYAEEGGTRETKPFALIETALREAGVTREEIECIAVGLGPGSYAGVRSAISIAQGWQLARGIKLLGISSAEVVAAQAGQSGNASVFIGLEAREGELLVARYDASNFERPTLLEFFSRMDINQAASRAIIRMDAPREVGMAQHFISSPPRADVLAGLAVNRTHFVRGDQIEPIYLRPLEFIKAPPPRFSAD